MLKDAFEDYKRFKCDREENEKSIKVWDGSKFVYKNWERLKIGEVIRIEEGDYFPADVLLLCSS